MPKYLIQGAYSPQGLKGVLKEGGSKRREAAEQLIKGTGGRLEAYYYAFGSDDFVIIAELPSNVDAAALSMAVNDSGAVQSRITVLITPEEADQATKKMKTVKYRPPRRIELRGQFDFAGRSYFLHRSHDAVIRVYDAAGKVIETDQHAGDFREP
jgi:uncharacterized protein with GYD domain